jgi:hypothetical protein
VVDDVFYPLWPAPVDGNTLVTGRCPGEELRCSVAAAQLVTRLTRRRCQAVSVGGYAVIVDGGAVPMIVALVVLQSSHISVDRRTTKGGPATTRRVRLALVSFCFR